MSIMHISRLRMHPWLRNLFHNIIFLMPKLFLVRGPFALKRYWTKQEASHGLVNDRHRAAGGRRDIVNSVRLTGFQMAVW